ncbi:unnamed protein product [Discosporangium mesarthrocarpum]
MNQREFREALAALQKGLPEAASMAALQGMELRSKRLLAGFEADQEAWVLKLTQLAREEPARLTSSCDDFLRLCKTFSNGGDYDDKELEEFNILLRGPHQEITDTAVTREETVDRIKREKKEAAGEWEGFKGDHTHCVADLSLREGLGQRYGAPRRKAQERLRTEIVRNDRCAATVDRLLDELEDLCASAWAAAGGKSIREASAEAFGEGGGGGRYREGPQKGCLYQTSTPAPFIPLPTAGTSISSKIRCCLLFLREAIFKHASFLEFLIAPGAVEWKKEVDPDPEGSREEATVKELGGVGAGAGARAEVGKGLDQEVALIPEEGSTFTAVVNTLEAQCRSETYLLYESEGKADLLREGGVPESLRVWLAESRAKALGDRGHREASCRRLRDQVIRFEHLIAKRPVPPEPSPIPLAAPAAMLLNLTSRLQEAALVHRKRQETKFDKLLAVWAAAREKHRRMLRPVLSSPDRRAELEEVLALEQGRAAEAKGAIDAFCRQLLDKEASRGRSDAEKLVRCFRVTVSILDSVVMVDDLGHLPGDELVNTKRKGLKRLRKAERALQRKETSGAPSSSLSPPTNTNSNDGGAPHVGRHWSRRKWKPADVSALAHLLQGASLLPPQPGGKSDTRVVGGVEKDDAARVGGGALHASAPLPSSAIKGKGGDVIEGKTAKGKEKEGKPVASKGVKGSEAGPAERAAVEGRANDGGKEADAEAWVEGLRGSMEVETFVTTAHRAAVAARDRALLNHAEALTRTVAEVQERHGRLLEVEAQWGAKWTRLVDLLVRDQD